MPDNEQAERATVIEDFPFPEGHLKKYEIVRCETFRKTDKLWLAAFTERDRKTGETRESAYKWEMTGGGWKLVGTYHVDRIEYKIGFTEVLKAMARHLPDE